MLLQDNGAVGDGETYDTAAIQAAIEDCAAHPEGGVMTFEENTRYLSAQITVRNGVRLRIPKTTTLLAGLKVASLPYCTQTCSRLYACRPAKSPSDATTHLGICINTVSEALTQRGCKDTRCLKMQPVNAAICLLTMQRGSAWMPSPDCKWWFMQREDYPKSYGDWYFIYLAKCNACGIEGEGRVDGQGSLWAYGG